MEQNVIEEQPKSAGQVCVNDLQNQCGGGDCENLANDACQGSSYGKFKTAESLMDAYNNLQAEFTRRCQRIKNLEKELENKTAEEAEVVQTTQIEGKNAEQTEIEGMQKKVAEMSDDQQQAEKDNSSETAHDINEIYNTAGDQVPSCPNGNYEQEFERLVSENELAKNYKKEIGEELLKDRTLSVASAFDRVLAKRYKEPSELACDSNFISNYILNNENVLKEIMNDVKHKQNTLPKIITETKGSIANSYPCQVATLQEAKELALKLLK